MPGAASPGTVARRGAGAGEVVHASCVAVNGRGLLISGASGSGKSGLALTLMALGARLVADDRTELSLRDDTVWAGCPPAIRGMIEARGLGILAADPAPPVPLAAEVDLDRAEPDRLPPARVSVRLGRPVPLILNGAGLPFAAALIQYLKGERLS